MSNRRRKCVVKMCQCKRSITNTMLIWLIQETGCRKPVATERYLSLSAQNFTQPFEFLRAITMHSHFDFRQVMHPERTVFVASTKKRLRFLAPAPSLLSLFRRSLWMLTTFKYAMKCPQFLELKNKWISNVFVYGPKFRCLQDTKWTLICWLTKYRYR